MAWYNNVKDLKNSGVGKAITTAYDPFNISGVHNPDKPSTADEEAAMRAAIEEWANSLPMEFEEYKSAGNLRPEMLETMPELGDSRLSSIQTDPRLQDAQMAALQELQAISKDGHTQADRAAMSSGMDQAAQQERSQRDAILANQAARGMGGSGSELAAQLANQQGAAMRNSQAGAQIGLDARQRALQALAQSGNLAGNMQGQAFDQQARIAQAQDTINRFNTETMIGRQQYNNQLANQAQASNLANKQAVMNQNTQGKNQFSQQQFENKGSVAGKNYDQASNQANRELGQYQNQMDNEAQKRSSYINAFGAIAGAAGGKK